MTSGFSRGRNARYGYYHCENRQCENRRSFPMQKLHDEFSSFLRTVSPKAELLEALGELIVEAAGRQQHDQVLRAEQHQARATRIAAQLTEVIRMRAQALLSDDEFLRAK